LAFRFAEVVFFVVAARADLVAAAFPAPFPALFSDLLAMSSSLDADLDQQKSPRSERLLGAATPCPADAFGGENQAAKP
jgi:hypothetical protein